jgi:hypothetical protein
VNPGELCGSRHVARDAETAAPAVSPFYSLEASSMDE